MFPHLQRINVQQWIDADRENWGVRRNIWEDSDFWAFIVRGPNPRREFHIDPGDEIFHQLEGELQLHYLAPEAGHAVAILRPGELFLMPANVPHSPRRGENSWTLVVERKRRPDEIERWVWYCEECAAVLHEVTRLSGEATDVVAQGTATLRAEPLLRTCRRCGHVSTV